MFFTIKDANFVKKSHERSRRFFKAGALLPTLFALVVALCCIYIYEKSILAAVRHQLGQAEQSMQRLSASTAIRDHSGNFKSQLAQQEDASNILALLQRLAARHGVVLAAAPSKDRLNQPSAGFHRTAWDVQLKGAYTPIKAMLAESLEQGAGLRLSQAQLRAVGDDVLANLTVQAWSYTEPALPSPEDSK